MKSSYKYLIILCSFFLFSCASNKKSIVKIKNNVFLLNNKEFNYIGANYWQGMNLGAPKSGNQERLIRELDELQELGITNLRILAASEADTLMKYAVHPALQIAPRHYNEDLWLGLDFLLSEMGKRNMKAVMVLGNFWTWSGGFSQYLKWSGAGKIPYPQDEGVSWNDFSNYSKQFYSNQKAQEIMNDHIKKVILRKNTITGTLYKNDATIMSWQIANEPRGYDVQKDYLKWIRKTAAFIKSLDKFHLVSLGSEGNTATSEAGTDVFRDNKDPNIDYITMHIWIQNWGWFNPTQGEKIYENAIKKVDDYWQTHVEAAKKLKKPLIIEEFGVARDNLSYNPEETTFWRDKFYDYIFNKTVNSIQSNGYVKGLNFWVYSGEGRPTKLGEFWRIGDTIIGDPAHELQGWYGVYNTDESTLEIIRKYAFKLK